MVSERGFKNTVTAVRDRMRGPSMVTGYSLAGTIVAVGDGVRDLVPGQRVACAGAASAHHAEVVAVPRNLVVPVPDGLDLDRAASPWVPSRSRGCARPISDSARSPAFSVWV